MEVKTDFEYDSFPKVSVTKRIHCAKNYVIINQLVKANLLSRM